MSSLVLSTVMSAIGTAAATASGITNVYTRPTEGIQPACVVVGYPEDDIDFNVTFQNGASRATFPVSLVLGLQTDESTHTLVSSLTTFALFEAIQNNAALNALGSVIVRAGRIEGWDLSANPDRPIVHTAVRFTVEVTA